MIASGRERKERNTIRLASRRQLVLTLPAVSCHAAEHGCSEALQPTAKHRASDNKQKPTLAFRKGEHRAGNVFRSARKHGLKKSVATREGIWP